MNPGRKYCVYLGKVDGDRKYEQLRYLLWTLHDLLEIINGNIFIENEESFITWNNGTPMTFAELYDFVKENKAYSFNRSIPHATCLCEVCENCVLLVKGFDKCKNISETLPTNPHDLVEKYACDSNLKDCMRNICTVCNTDECINLYIKCQESSDESSDTNSDDHSSDETDVTYYNGQRKGNIFATSTLHRLLKRQ